MHLQNWKHCEKGKIIQKKEFKLYLQSFKLCIKMHIRMNSNYIMYYRFLKCTSKCQANTIVFKIHIKMYSNNYYLFKMHVKLYRNYYHFQNASQNVQQLLLFSKCKSKYIAITIIFKMYSNYYHFQNASQNSNYYRFQININIYSN